MASIGINVYALSVFGSKAQQIDLHNVINGKDIIDIITEYIQSNIYAYIDNNNKESIYKFVDCEIVEQTDEDGNVYLKYLYGRIKSGNYGVESEIVDKTTGTVTHVKSTTEANVLPFDFMLILPAGISYQTVCIIQTQGIYGVKTQLEYGFSEYIRNISISLKLHMGAIYPKAYVEKFLNEGILKKIRLFHYNIPNEMADRYGVVPGTRGKGAQKELIISSPEGFHQKTIQNIRECVRGIRKYSEIVEIDDMECSELKLDFKLGRKEKTISLTNLERVVVSEDITDNVILQNGNPTKESIIPVMIDTGIGYLIGMGHLAKVENINGVILKRYNPEKGRIENVEKD